jgi:hypothetical protein
VGPIPGNGCPLHRLHNDSCLPDRHIRASHDIST